MSARFPKKRRTKTGASPKVRTSDEFFDSLVENAIDFLKRSVSEIKKSPKYSVIDFCAALEIFLKARLMVEHWSIIVLRPEIANLSTFKNGDFQSVAMDEAMRRLENICNDSISKEAKDSFDAVRKHRNKLLHFFHPDYIKASQQTIETIVTEQCKAWFYLYRLLMDQWQAHFRKHKKGIEKLDQRMHTLRAFLRAKYEALKPDIDAEVRKGKQYEDCSSCGFKAAGIDEVGDPLYESLCRVCSAKRRMLLATCPECEETIKVEDMGEGQCDKCQFEVDIDYLLEEFGPNEDPREPSSIAYCSECEYVETSTAIPFGDGYLCLSCLTEHGSADNCGFCNELCTGIDPVSASLFGCIKCEGSVAQDHT